MQTESRSHRSFSVAAIAVVGLLVLAVVASAASAGGGGPDKRKCGVLPGEGFYNYVKVRNVSCREARKVGNKAGRKFCAHSNRCATMPTDDPVKGRVNARGWRCKVKVGYESYQARCRKGDMRFLQRSGA